MTSLEVKNLSKIFPDGTKALDNVNFSISPGEAVVLLGHNGSGKSTLFNCIAGFENPSLGQVMVGDIDITQLNYQQLRPIRRRVGKVFQHFHLVNNLNVLQNVLFGALGRTTFSFQTFAPIASKQLRDRAMNCLERVGLSDFAKRRADQLSGGQQQRVAIARMLLQEPEIVLADEPIASLDPAAGREVMDLLWKIVKEENLTVVCVLHQMNIAKEYGKRIIALKKGKLVLDNDISTISERSLEGLYKQENNDISLMQVGQGGDVENEKSIKSNV
ncbi:phosphonate ABC transporter ATP-binding protein [Bacillaceae bacterium IKA-2]|nr:phosphonate ABC transporter ATP-binding protein [Bacillaceae bacterium IKA-2]